MDLPVPQTPLAAGVDPEFLRRKAPELAKDIVLKIGGARELATQAYNLSDAQWDALRVSPGFLELMRMTAEELSGPVGIAEKARRQARIAVAEYVIADMAAMSGDPKIGAQHRIKAGEVLIEVAGISGKSAVQQAAAGFGGPLVQIIMPDGRTLGIGIPNQPVIEGEKA